MKTVFHARRRKGLTSAAVCAVVLFAACDPAHSAGADFINEALILYRAAACGAGPLPTRFSAAMIDSHCREMKKKYDHYDETFIRLAAPFMAAVLPRRIPRRVVIPFGGGDLMPALTIFPHATEFTTISLESAGDPRRFAKASPAEIAGALEAYRVNVGFMLLMYDNSNDTVRNMDRGGIIPGQLAYALTALAAMGYEPLSLRFFRINDDGSLSYLNDDDIAALERVKAQRLKATWVDTDYSVAFRNMELVFRKKGGGPRIVHRHIAFNLDNAHFTGSGLEKHLAEKGRITAMIKGASYLPWFNNFSAIRNYLLMHMDICVSDATGILPRHAAEAGFTQVTYGTFTGAFLDNDGGTDAAALRGLFQSQQSRPLPFEFGYSDIHRAKHLIITKLKD